MAMNSAGSTGINKRKWNLKYILPFVTILVAIVAIVVSAMSAMFSYSQLNSLNHSIIYQRMDSYFQAYSEVQNNNNVDVFSNEIYQSSPNNQVNIALTTERLLLVLDAVNRAGLVDLSETWYGFLLTTNGPLCDPKMKLEGFAIEKKTQGQLVRAKQSKCPQSR